MQSSELTLVAGTAVADAAPKVLLVFPTFNPNSFWSFKETCEIIGAGYPAPPLGLITLAALLPSDWDCRLVNCNTMPLTDADIDWCDMVMTGGMLPQQSQSLEVMARCQARGKPVVVGGPDPTSSPHVYAAADFLVLGEAEGIIDTFIAAWRRGERSGRFDAEKFTADVTKIPVPRYDLLDFSQYLYIGLQFSRGCPFTCEFCDIIELYGRVPRAKTNAQMLAELDRLYALGYRGHVDWVDDNLIGNKKALKRLLPDLKKWQEARFFPFKFSTEASLNLADDPELLRMLAECNFFACFIGIESGDAATLTSMQKKQNTKRSIDESIHRIYEAGLYVMAGFIVGFDTERERVADDMTMLIEATSIPICTVGLLTALPNTQLTRRLGRENRLYEKFEMATPDAGDACLGGLNFTTLRPRREILEDYRAVVDRIYGIDAFFARVTKLAQTLRRPPIVRGPSDPAKLAKDLVLLRRLLVKICLRQPSIAIPLWRLISWTLKNNPAALDAVMMNVGMYMHVRPFARHVVKAIARKIDDIERGREPARVLLAAPALVKGAA